MYAAFFETRRALIPSFYKAVRSRLFTGASQLIKLLDPKGIQPLPMMQTPA